MTSIFYINYFIANMFNKDMGIFNNFLWIIFVLNLEKIK